MKIVVIGSGYVGLVAGACFSDFGFNVVCVDNNQAKIDNLKKGILPIYEPGLSEIVQHNVQAERLSFTTNLATALKGADAAFIAVGTPPRPNDGHADMKYVYAVAEEIGRQADGDLVVVDKSTVPVGTGDVVERILRTANPKGRFAVVSNPEFLREGVAIGDFKKPDRIVIGAEEGWARDVMTDLYSCPGFEGAPIVHTSRRSAELIKYAANAFLATKIMFINEMCDLCEAAGGDIRDVAKGMGMDSRIGEKFLNAGPGYGGSCFPKDTLAIAKTARDHRVGLDLVESVIRSNDNRKRAMAWKLIDALDGDLAGKTVAVLGLTFKAHTDDMRDSPAIAIVQALLDKGATVRGFDPEGMENAKALLPGITYCANAYEAAANADAIAIVTEWPEFAELDLAHLKTRMSRPVIVDYRNMIKPATANAAGFVYTGLGYPNGSFTQQSYYTAVAAE
ncbi:UDP-glucose dehydrogenase family protein [Roseibium sp.]|uniref:UDP-glucose dehydrogenase family protein n=1 Tax=Roseibium sp. TaxID=1936156 RepID=UPI003A97B3BA